MLAYLSSREQCRATPQSVIILSISEKLKERAKSMHITAMTPEEYIASYFSDSK